MCSTWSGISPGVLGPTYLYCRSGRPTPGSTHRLDSLSPAPFQYMRQEMVYIGQVIVPRLDADADETVETLALLVAVEGVSA